MGGRQEPPDVAWLVPELDDGADDPLLRPELEELEFDELEPEPDEPEPEVDPDEPEPSLVEPELSVPEDDPVDPVDPDEAEPCEDDVPLCEPGRTRAITPAATTLASPTVAVVARIGSARGPAPRRREGRCLASGCS